MASRKTISYWLLGCVAVVTTLLLILPQLIDSDTLKAKLQTTVETQIGGQFNFQQVELSFLPRPSITLRQVKLDIPEQVQGTVGTIQLYPELYALLTGQVHLAKLILDSPEVSLNLPAVDTNKEEPPSTLTFSTLQNNLTEVLVPLAKAAPNLALVLNDGTLSINQEQQTLGLANNLNLTLKLAAAPHTSLQVNLQLSASDVTLHRDGHQSIIEGLALNGTLRADEKRISLSIDNLALVRPALQIKGELKSVPASPGFEVDLQAAGLDVDEIRKMALAIAGDTSPVKEIFDYLRGGTVPQISFHSQGETASELGDLKNILIKGHLQEGAVSIPEIKLDLTEVNGDVLIKGGILEGSGMSTRLEGASGSDGALKISLIEGNDLFQLELILDADLGQAQKILKRIVGDPAFGQEIDKITKLSGNSTGKLVLGNSLNDINARVDITVSNLSANCQGLPFPVGITTGQILFAEDQVKLKDLNGTFGRSVFTGLACNIDLQDVLHLDLSSGKFGLVLDEIYPWVASFEGAKESLKGIKQITGHLDLATLSLKGADDAPEDWQVLATGVINDLSIEKSQSSTETELTKDDSFNKSVLTEKSPSVIFDVEYLSEQLQVKQLTVKDQYSDANLVFTHNRDEFNLNFTGSLHHETLKSLFIDQQFGTGQLEGDFNVKVPLVKQALPVAKGRLEGKGLVIPLPSGEKITIEKIELTADGTLIKADASTVSWNDFTWSPFNFTIDFAQDKIYVKVNEAKLCGIDSTGLLTVDGKKLSLDFTLEGKGLDVASSYSCLTEGRVKMTGTLDFSSQISAQGEAENLINNMQGPIEMNFKKGSIEQSKLLARTLAVLNVTEIVKGKLPDLGTTGFAYSLITMKGAFEGEKLLIETLFMDGETLDVLGEGELDFGKETVDVELLAAPFKTANTVVRNIPGVNYLLAGSLVTIPVSVKGDLADPRVRVMSASSVGSSLLGLGGRIIKSPLKLIETLTPKKDDAKK